MTSRHSFQTDRRQCDIILPQIKNKIDFLLHSHETGFKCVVNTENKHSVDQVTCHFCFQAYPVRISNNTGQIKRTPGFVRRRNTLTSPPPSSIPTLPPPTNQLSFPPLPSEEKVTRNYLSLSQTSVQGVCTSALFAIRL